MIFNGWTESETHYLAVFAGVPFDNENGYKTYLLGFSPFENENSQNAEEHKCYFEYVHSLFGKSRNNVIALCGDNCNTNQAFANLVEKTLVACSPHRFNLAVRSIFESYRPLLKKVNDLMRIFRNPIPAAHLWKRTELRAQRYNSTRWSSVAAMLHRYQQIKQYLPDLELPSRYNFEENIPSHRENKRIDSLCDLCIDLDSVTKILQRGNLTLAQARLWLTVSFKNFLTHNCDCVLLPILCIPLVSSLDWCNYKIIRVMN